MCVSESLTDYTKMRRFNITKKGYRFDRYIFLGYILVMFLTALGTISYYNFDFRPKIYFVCDASECPNPYFFNKKCAYEWCFNETLQTGAYGDPPPPKFAFVNIFPYVFVLLLVTLLFVNHFLHNKGKMFHLDIMEVKLNEENNNNGNK